MVSIPHCATIPDRGECDSHSLWSVVNFGDT
jgi:hypothetical protein